MLKKRIDIWLPAYLASAVQRLYHRLMRTKRHTHIIFLVCDHYEPSHAAADAEQAVRRVKTWHKEYAAFQARCRSEFGTAPLHTWFYPPHHGYGHLADLAAMAHDGLGEVELHYHHDGDTEVTLERDLRAAIGEYNRWGLLLESGAQPRTSFGFIHGDWALGNSCGGKLCGVNDELTILQRLGCWADLTMPSGGPCQTHKINSIYYAKGDPHRPKSHNRGADAEVGKTDQDGMMLMQGPLGLNFGAPSYPRIENASLTTQNWGRSDRIRKWLDCNVHVKGRPEWLFVKLHAHGAVEKDFDCLFGEKAMQMHRELNTKYNDGKRYSLHYVTARQAYNIAKAAEHGHTGNPADYLDFSIPEPATAFYVADARHTLEHCTAHHLKLSSIEAGNPVRLRMRVGPIAQAQGAIVSYEVDAQLKRVRIEATGVVELSLRDGAAIDSIEGGKIVAGENGMQYLHVDRNCTLQYQ